jgi:hypothetical protein
MMELMIKLNNLLQEKVNQQAKKNLLYSRFTEKQEFRSTDFRLRNPAGGRPPLGRKTLIRFTYILNNIKNNKLFDYVTKITVFGYLGFTI